MFYNYNLHSVADPAARWGGGGGEKHEIYVATFGGHLVYDLFSQGRGGGEKQFNHTFHSMMNVKNMMNYEAKFITI